MTEGSAFAYAPALESTASLTLRERYGLFIGGNWVAAADGALVATQNPATEATLAHVSRAGAADVDRAVRAARRGYEKYWRKLAPSERGKYIYRVARALSERAREFAIIETLDVGKPIGQTREFDVPLAAGHFFYYAGWAGKLAWAQAGDERERPLGVVGAIVPWNCPLLSAAWKLAPALACGNTVVLKPPQSAPLAALLLADVFAAADFPPGVINIVTGDAETGAALAEHLDVDAIVFSGSTDAGKTIRRTTAGSGKRLSLELASKTAIIVYDDAPFDQAIEGIVSAISPGYGQAGAAGARLLVQENVAADVVTRLHARIATLRHGDPLDKNTDIGAMHSRSGRDRLVELVRTGVDEGATLAQADFAPPERGFWFPASLFTNVQPTYRIAREDIAGPVLPVMTFRTPDEAIERANSLPSGLSAGIWTSSGALALYTAERVRAGVIWCNAHNRFDPSSPFGGIGESGFGRTGGAAGLADYLR
jgi:aldehyde dehydrogenase (NAD+)